MLAQPFGTLPDGQTVDVITIAAGEVQARVLTYGAVIQDIRLVGVEHPLVLGFPTLEGYLSNPNYYGAVAGRYANRIAGGRFTLDGTPYQLTPNEGANHLHGGPNGFGTRLWRLLRADASSVTLGLEDADGSNGYPGTVRVELTYAVEAPARLRTTIRATTDAPTIINLAQHSYFNLSGGATIRDHLLTIPAETYLPVDAALIPTGERRTVEGTDYDFRTARPVGTDADSIVALYDHNFVVTEAKTEAPHPLARLVAPTAGVALDILSTEPGVQFYGGHGVKTRDLGLTGALYGPNAGLCLEPQLFPDSPNRPDFPSAVLRPGETYRQETLFVFSRI